MTAAGGSGAFRGHGWPICWPGWQRFDTGAFQARLDRLTHLQAVVGEQVIHLVHAPGHGPAPLPLVLTHGWPSSFCEYLDILPLLTDPGAHGGDPDDAFTVGEAPSLPGFVLSRPTPRRSPDRRLRSPGSGTGS